MFPSHLPGCISLCLIFAWSSLTLSSARVGWPWSSRGTITPWKGHWWDKHTLKCNQWAISSFFLFLQAVNIHLVNIQKRAMYHEVSWQQWQLLAREAGKHNAIMATGHMLMEGVTVVFSKVARYLPHTYFYYYLYFYIHMCCSLLFWRRGNNAYSTPVEYVRAGHL